MKILILASASILICLNIFAQDVQPCQFIGLYASNKKGVCSDRAMMNEGVADNAAYYVKRKTFMTDHEKDHPQTYFVAANEAVIAYEYEKRIAGWGCNAKVISIKKGKSLEDCNKQLADHLAKAPNDFATPPNTIFTWQGKGLSAGIKSKPGEYTKDYGGLAGKFISGNTATKDIIVAQLTNKTKDKRANVLLRTDDGKMTMEYVYPGNTLTKNYNSKKIEIQVQYEDYNAPKPADRVYEFFKGKAWEVLTIVNGEITVRKWDPACMCVRG